MPATKKKSTGKKGKPKDEEPKAEGKRSRKGKPRAVDLIRQVLASHPDGLPVADILDKIMEFGYGDGNRPASFPTYVSQIVRKHPEAGIERVSRGVYRLNKDAMQEALALPVPAQVAQHVTAEVVDTRPSYEGLSAETLVAILHERDQTIHQLRTMGLSQVRTTVIALETA